ncbi:MAG TPA: DNA polymerase III subunit delta' [Geobacteraceae bacterium]|nr:DNA polymerase III subunit delta' [Geobacteraceae bacterium]
MPFAGILGHDNCIAVLRHSLASDKTAHAYLFEGIEGCGKKKTALAFIEAVFCGRDEGCGICPSCRKLAAGNHPDLHLVEPDGSFIKIDQIRELQRELAFRPFEAPKKACIIDAADRLNPAAGNALLKTLEEPPGNALLVLITDNAEGVLPTVLSRCQRLHFSALPEATIAALLRDSGVEEGTARIAASLSGGSMRKAMDTGAETLLLERKGFLDRIGSLSLGDVTTLFAAAEELAGEKEKVLELLELLTTFLRDTLIMESGCLEIVNSDLVPLIEREAAGFPKEKIMERIGHVADARTAILSNVNTRLALDVLFMRLAAE